MADSERNAKAMLLLECYEAEQALERAREQCVVFTEALNEVRDWLQSSHREYSAFENQSHLESRSALLNANIIENAQRYRELLDFDRMLKVVADIRETRSRVVDLTEQRKKLGIAPKR